MGEDLLTVIKVITKVVIFLKNIPSRERSLQNCVGTWVQNIDHFYTIVRNS